MTRTQILNFCLLLFQFFFSFSSLQSFIVESVSTHKGAASSAKSNTIHPYCTFLPSLDSCRCPTVSLRRPSISTPMNTAVKSLSVLEAPMTKALKGGNETFTYTKPNKAHTTSPTPTSARPGNHSSSCNPRCKWPS